MLLSSLNSQLFFLGILINKDRKYKIVKKKFLFLILLGLLTQANVTLGMDSCEKPSLLQLPDKTFYYIFWFLPQREVFLNSPLVCKRFNDAKKGFWICFGLIRLLENSDFCCFFYCSDAAKKSCWERLKEAFACDSSKKSLERRVCCRLLSGLSWGCRGLGRFVLSSYKGCHARVSEKDYMNQLAEYLKWRNKPSSLLISNFSARDLSWLDYLKDVPLVSLKMELRYQDFDFLELLERVGSLAVLSEHETLKQLILVFMKPDEPEEHFVYNDDLSILPSNIVSLFRIFRDALSRTRNCEIKVFFIDGDGNFFDATQRIQEDYSFCGEMRAEEDYEGVEGVELEDIVLRGCSEEESEGEE